MSQHKVRPFVRRREDGSLRTSLQVCPSNLLQSCAGAWVAPLPELLSSLVRPMGSFPQKQHLVEQDVRPPVRVRMSAPHTMKRPLHRGCVPVECGDIRRVVPAWLVRRGSRGRRCTSCKVGVNAQRQGVGLRRGLPAPDLVVRFRHIKWRRWHRSSSNPEPSEADSANLLATPDASHGMLCSAIHALKGNSVECLMKSCPFQLQAPSHTGHEITWTC